MNIALSSDDQLELSDGKGWSITVPATLGGAQVIVHILRARRRGEEKLATAGAPTQRQVDDLAKMVKDYYAKTLPSMNVDVEL